MEQSNACPTAPSRESAIATIKEHVEGCLRELAARDLIEDIDFSKIPNEVYEQMLDNLMASLEKSVIEGTSDLESRELIPSKPERSAE